MQKNPVYSIIFGALITLGFLSLVEKTSYVLSNKPVEIVAGDAKAPSKIEKVKEEFAKIESKDDKILIYKQFAGASDFLFSAKKLTHTGQFDPILGRVQSSYGWNREVVDKDGKIIRQSNYPEFTNAVSEFLIEKGYDDPKKLETREDIESFRKIFQELSEATKYE